MKYLEFDYNGFFFGLSVGFVLTLFGINMNVGYLIGSFAGAFVVPTLCNYIKRDKNA